MRELLDVLGPQGTEPIFSPLDVLAMLVVTTLCLFVISRNYQATHRGTSYAQSYIHALFLMGLCTGIVMMIIGSNIARAFSLVGALSIIRFRTAVKDVRDTAYLFFAIIVGMGSGTGFYLHTAMFTLLASAFMWGLFRFDYARKDEREEIVKITYKRGAETAARIEEYLRRTFRDARMINSIRDFGDDEETLVYVVRHSGAFDEKALTDGLARIDNVTRSVLYASDQQVTL